jgi:hypothetical protein
MLRTLSLLALATACAFALRAQTPAAPKSPLEQLKAMKAANQAQLEKQAALLLKLEEVQKEAQQIRFLTKRG